MVFVLTWKKSLIMIEDNRCLPVFSNTRWKELCVCVCVCVCVYCFFFVSKGVNQFVSLDTKYY
jgi:hypothetical protein